MGRILALKNSGIRGSFRLQRQAQQHEPANNFVHPLIPARGFLRCLDTSNSCLPIRLNIQSLILSNVTQLTDLLQASQRATFEAL